MGKQAKLFHVPATGVKVSKRKFQNFDRVKVNHTLAKRRYYLHRRLQKGMFSVDGATRIIDSKYSSLDEMPAKQQEYIRELIDMRYSVQYKVLPQDEYDALVVIKDPPLDFAAWANPLQP